MVYPKVENVISLILIILVAFGFSINHANAQAGPKDVNIVAKVNYQINIKVYPEKRIPATANWSNQNTVEIRLPNSTTSLFTQVVNTNANGDGVMTSVDSDIIPPGNYDFAIKGYSHLRKKYSATLGNNIVTNIDFTSPRDDLLAGDTSIIEDNYVNSLDLSQISINLYSANLKNDLNRDTLVNSLDLSNMAFNLYVGGDD